MIAAASPPTTSNGCCVDFLPRRAAERLGSPAETVETVGGTIALATAGLTGVATGVATFAATGMALGTGGCFAEAGAGAAAGGVGGAVATAGLALSEGGVFARLAFGAEVFRVFGFEDAAATGVAFGTAVFTGVAVGGAAFTGVAVGGTASAGLAVGGTASTGVAFGGSLGNKPGSSAAAVHSLSVLGRTKCLRVSRPSLTRPWICSLSYGPYSRSSIKQYHDAIARFP